MGFTPLSDRVLIAPDPVEETTEGGIILQQTDTNASPTKGEVITMGPGRYDNGKLLPMGVKIGDRVIWTKFAGSHITVDGDDFLLMRESDITGVL